MPLSRLENFLKNAEGNILYVNPSDFDATDSFENQGNSLTRPFKTIQRALIEAARFSYQAGDNNDRIDRTTILVYPGTHYIDNRPGFSIEEINGSAVYKKRTGPETWTPDSLDQFSETTNYDILDPSNDLYKFNSVNGGAILPRGTSIIGLDLRKTKIRPLYVPNPEDAQVDRSSILNVTGTCYFTAFSIFDGDPTKTVFRDYTDVRVVPNYSHHKLTVFEYADGVNYVKLGNYQTYLTDLDMYYFKVTKAYGDVTGRALTDYPIGNDFEPSVDEFRIVGSLDANPLGISSIRAGNGDGTGDLNLITVTTSNKQTGATAPHNLFVDSPFLIGGVTIDSASYNGSFTVKEVVGINTFTFITNNAPTEYLPPTGEIDTATLTIGSDTVSSASPYIFNCSLRSVFGMNGMHADGNRATGFKSMVVAQYTGVSLQKDNNAFILYQDGIFYDENTLPTNSLEKPLHTNSSSVFKPEYENFHIKCSNNAFIQCVSIFAIGFAKHFVTETGGDMSITNSNSNFGNTSLESIGFKPESFDRDDVGYITHVIPPKEVPKTENEVTWLSLDTIKILNSVDPARLYLYGANNEEIAPAYQVDGYRIGAKENDQLNLTITIGTAQTSYTSPILMPVSGGAGVSARKEYTVSRTNGENNITSDTLTFTESHQLINGERIRIFSDTGETPDGLENEGIYFAITDGVGTNQIKVAQSFNDALADVPILGLTKFGGVIKIVSRVSDKLPGEFGHPIQWDSTESNWYVNSTPSTATNEIYSAVVGIGTVVIGEETSSTFIKRQLDNRSIDDKIYKIRYVIPKEYENAKPPEAGYVIQESKTVGVTSISYTNDVLTSVKDLRNEKVISDASVGVVINNNQVVTITTEIPHNLNAGDSVNVQKIRSTNNLDATGITSSYNGIYVVDAVLNSKQFQYTISGVSTNPGTFNNDINLRSTRQQREALPVVSRASYKDTYFIYRVSQIKRHIPGADGQDGIYHLICLAANVSPSSTVGYQLFTKDYNQDVTNLYPQLDRDNLNTNPLPSVTSADLRVLGNVITNDKRNSITREAVNYFVKNTKIGLGITAIGLSGVGNTEITVNTDIEHNLNSIKTFTFSSGSGYSASATIYSVELSPISSNGEGATAVVTTDPSGAVSDITLLDAGSSYNVGDTLSVAGGSVNSIITVTGINDNNNTVMEIGGINIPDLNDAFEILSIPNSKEIVLHAPLGISTYEPNTNGEKPFIIPTGESLGITSALLTDVSTGIATFITSSAHGLFAGNKVKIVNTNATGLEGDFVVRDVTGISTFTVVAYGATVSAVSDTGSVFRKTFDSNARNIGSGEENLGSRASYLYDKVSVNIDVALDTSSTTISFSDATAVKRGDYYTINSEVVRIASSSNPFTVLRGQFGTFKTTAPVGSVARKIKVLPAEIRRPSFMRASSHTFEYLGFGPGNYSTGMPQRQDRILSEDEVLNSQAKEQRGGSVVYTGMNDLGEFFSGSKKLSSATGEETVIDAPILSYTGDDSQGESAAVSSGIFDELLVRQRLTVEGGENNNQASQFYGPVNFTNKLTNVSDLGIETKNLYLKGTAAQAKLITVGVSTPTAATIPSPKSGDIQLLSNPSDNYAGHIRVDNEWRPFALISRDPDSLDIGVDKLSIGIATSPAYDFYVEGDSRVQNMRIDGTLQITQPQSLGDVTFENIIVNRTAKYTGTWTDPLTGIPSSYTQIHDTGISLLNDLEVSGISTFAGAIYAESNIYGIGAKFGNIRIAIKDDNTIDTTVGDLTIDSSSGRTTIIDDLYVKGNDLVLQTGEATSIGGTISAGINLARDLYLGVGSTDGSSSITLHANDTNYPNGSLILRKNNVASGETTELIHRGASQFTVNGQDFGSSFLLKTSNTDRVLVGSSGTVTVYQNNAGQGLRGGHLKLTQAGSGDVALSWDITNNNSNVRWYAGIDTSDSYAWKLAFPPTTLAYNSENFGNANETKLKVDTLGNFDVLGNVNIGGTTISTPSATFNLLNTNSTIINAFQAASSITIGSNSNTSVVTLRSTKNATGTTNAGLVVAGGVGIAGNLYVGGHHGNTDIQGTLAVSANTDLNGELDVAKKVNIGGDVSIAGFTTVAKSLVVNNNLQVDGTVQAGVTTADAFVKRLPGDPTNFLRADGTDNILQNADYINSLGFVPGPPITVSTFPIGNSIILDDISPQFNGVKATFNLTRNNGTAFVPIGAVNLIVSIGGVIQQANRDYFVPTVGGGGATDYDSKITFSTAPSAGLEAFIIALGGQGSLLSNQDWDKKGQIPVGISDNTAVMVDVGTNGQVLTADSTKNTGVAWKDIPVQVPTGTVFYFATDTAPDGYLICNGETVPNGNGTIQGVTKNFSALYALLGSKYGAPGKLPNLLGNFVAGGGASGYTVGASAGANTVTLSSNQMPSHNHPVSMTAVGNHTHPGSSTNAGGHQHSTPGSTNSAGSHGHTANANAAGSHGHGGSVGGGGQHRHPYDKPNTNNTPKQPGGGPQPNKGTQGANTGGAGNHGHPLSINAGGQHGHGVSVTAGGAHSHTISIGSAGGHTHPVSVGSGGGHNHSVSSGAVGGGAAHENRPPFVALLPVIKH